MGDTFIEQLVKQRQTSATILKKCGLIFITIISFYLVLIMPILLFVPVILIVVDVILFKRMDLEFEYVYFNGDLDIDKIMSKQSRKRVFSTDMGDVLVVAPTGSIELHPYQQAKTLHLGSNLPDARTYELVTTYKGSTVRIVFEPSEELLQGMRMKAPRKVFL